MTTIFTVISIRNLLKEFVNGLDSLFTYFPQAVFLHRTFARRLSEVIQSSQCTNRAFDSHHSDKRLRGTGSLFGYGRLHRHGRPLPSKINRDNESSCRFYFRDEGGYLPDDGIVPRCREFSPKNRKLEGNTSAI